MLATTTLAYEMQASYQVYKPLKTTLFEQINQENADVLSVKPLVNQETLNFYIQGALFRAERQWGHDHLYEVGESLHRLKQGSPELTKTVNETDGKVFSRQTTEVDIQDIANRLRLKNNTTKYQDNGQLATKKKYAYFDLHITKPECETEQYKFNHPKYKRLIGCSLLRKLRKERWVKTGETEQVELELRLKGEERIQKTTAPCDYYQSKLALSTEVGLPSLTSKVCIAMHYGIPVAYIRETNSQPSSQSSGQSTTEKKRYQLTILDFAPKNMTSMFDFKAAELCAGGDARGKWWRCKT